MPETAPSRLSVYAVVALACLLTAVIWLWPRPRPHNVVIFIADGLRSQMVDETTAPTMAAIRSEGVDFRNSHALYPTVTTPNASAIATGHGLGDTGDFGNTIWVGAATSPATPSKFAGLEDDDVLGTMNARYGGNYLREQTLLAAARAKGFSTAVIGKRGPAAIQDVTSRDGQGTIVIDDDTGGVGGLALSKAILQAMKAAGISPVAEDRGLNGDPGAYNRAGVRVANVQQQNWFVAVATKVLLPRFQKANKPFVLVFWSRDPDGTQHGQGDSLNTLVPGINGPTTMAGIRNADNDLKSLRDAVRALGLEKTTDIVVTADHGFSVAARTSATSAAAKNSYIDTPKGFLPRGFLAADLAKGLNLNLFDGAGLPVNPPAGEHVRTDASLIGPDAAHPVGGVASNGGSDLIYLFGPNQHALAERIVALLSVQDYLGGVFVSNGLGAVPGTLPMSRIGLVGGALTPQPTMVIGFRSFSTGCARPEVCGAEVADTEYQQGQGIHGSFSRADTHNFMAAIGPDFRRGFVDPAPVSNADWAPTLARILHLNLGGRGSLKGRPMSEALKGGKAVNSGAATERSALGPNGFLTVLNLQTVGKARYFDAAGMPGRVLGLKP